ncbi:hypothetical protein MMC22_002251 [Lobaria immixta]|nr:hypothetical protein [Lobaria immixta]
MKLESSLPILPSTREFGPILPLGNLRMEPVSAVGLAAGAVQFADVGVGALIGMVKLLKRLKETPKRMAELLQDVGKSIQRIITLRNAMQQPNSLFAHLSIAQLQRVMGNVDDAYQATTDLQHWSPSSERAILLGMAGLKILGDLGNADLASQVGKQLIKNPSSLKAASKKTILAKEAIEHCRLKKDKRICTCAQNPLVPRTGPFGTAGEFITLHTAKCPYHQSLWRSWNYSLSVRLLPIVQKTVKITFAANFGAGGSSIGTSLRSLCVENIFKFGWQTVRLAGRSIQPIQWTAHSTDRDTASYSDEHGNTLLHAIFALIGLLGSNFHHFHDQLKNLAKLVIDAGVQVDAASQPLAFDYESDFMRFGAISRPSTVFDMAANIAMQVPQPIECIPLYEIIGEFLDDQASEIPLDFGRDENDLVGRKAALIFSRRHPQLLDYFGYGQLEEAIACRSLAQMNHILQMEESWTRYFEEFPYKRLSPVELAIGRLSGLQKLIDLGFYADVGLSLSIYMGDLRSTKIILAAENFPRKKDAWTKVLFDLSWSSRKIEQIVIQTFSRRRQALAELAIKEFLEEAKCRLGVLNGKPLDAAAPGAYQELQKRSVKVPQNLNPASSDKLNSNEHVSIYHSIFHYHYISPPSRGLLHSFYINGFGLVDSLDAAGQTPLLRACKDSTGLSWSRGMLLSIRWLLDKGACPNFSCTDSYSNVLFYIATSYARSLRDVSKYISENFKRLIRRAASLCDPICSDGCQCYCSSAGCLPYYKFWKCDAIPYDHEDCELITRGTLFDALHQWLCLCGIDEAQSELCYEEVFRLEVFDRLGMAHTFCGYQKSSMDKKDRTQLQEEDAELREQLDLIIPAYRNRFKKHAGGLKDFWKSFMQGLDEILPALIPEERCRLRCLSFTNYLDYKHSTEYLEKERAWHDLRTKMEEEALARKEYLGLDFINVIHHHFADALGPRSSDPVGNSSESLESLKNPSFVI